MNLLEVAKAVKGDLLGSDAEVSGFSIDSRSVQPKEVFIALRGPNFDGHDYTGKALQSGAEAIVVERKVESQGRPQIVVADAYQALNDIAIWKRKNFKGKVAAITGSCGKTTVRGMLQSICEQAGNCVATKGNLNNLIGVPLSMSKLNSKADYAVFEAGANELGEIVALAELIKPELALVNNVMPSHVEGFGSVEKIAEEKTELLKALPENGIAIINLDDGWVDYFIECSGPVRKIGFSVDVSLLQRESVAELVLAENVSANSLGAPNFDLFIGQERTSCQLGVIGLHNVGNALAAAAFAVGMNIPMREIIEGLTKYSGEARRMQVREQGLNGTLIDDTYNASPGSVRAAIDYLKQFNSAALVLGDMGELGAEEEVLHREVGLYAKEVGIEALFATGILAAETANAFGAGALWCESQSELVEKLDGYRKEGNIVLVKGSRFMRMDKVADALCQREGSM